MTLIPDIRQPDCNVISSLRVQKRVEMRILVV